MECKILGWDRDMPKRVGHQKRKKGKWTPRPTLVAWRKHRFPGKSRAYVAGVLDISDATLLRYESGETGVSDAAAKKLAAAYGTDTWTLFNDYPGNDSLLSLLAGATDEQKKLITGIAITILKSVG